MDKITKGLNGKREKGKGTKGHKKKRTKGQTKTLKCTNLLAGQGDGRTCQLGVDYVKSITSKYNKYFIPVVLYVH